VQLHPCAALRHIAVGGRAVGVGTQIAEGMFRSPTLSFSFCRVSRNLLEIRGSLFQAAKSLSVYSRPCRGEILQFQPQWSSPRIVLRTLHNPARNREVGVNLA
jgi:hypothetical protein